MRVSVIATVYNEGESIRRLMDSLMRQTRRPDEVVICDGGSQDETVAILQTYSDRLSGLQIITTAGANISQGRNTAIAAVAGPIVAATDAGVRLDAHWLERLVAPFEGEAGYVGADVNAVAGFFLPDVPGFACDTPTDFAMRQSAQKIFQMAMAATVLPRADEIDPAKFLPSSRSVAFRKDLWQQVGGYPEWLDYCEDLVFDLRIRSVSAGKGLVFAWAPDAIAYFRPRPSLIAYWRQYFRYARGDGKADLWRKRHAIRYATYLLLLPALVGHGLWGQGTRWLGWLGLLLGGIAYCVRPWQRLWLLGKGVSGGAWLCAALLVPLIRLVGDGAKMAGYPFGLAWRRRNQHRADIHWREEKVKL